MLKDLLNNRPEVARAGLAALLLMVCLLAIPAANNPLQQWLGDKAQQHHSPVADASKVVVVAIDEASQTQLGPWPWPNSQHALLVEQLRSNGASAIAFVTPLSAANSTTSVASPTQTHSINDTQLLARAMRAQGRVVLALQVSTNAGVEPGRELVTSLTRSQRHFGGDSLTPAIEARPLTSTDGQLIGAAAALGHTLSPTDSDGHVRREYAAIKIGDQALPALSVALANLASSERNTLVVTAEQLQLTPGAKVTALGSRVDFTPKHGKNSIVSMPYWQALQGDFDPQLFKDKAVVIGFTEGAEADRIETALGSLPRATVIAMNANALLNGQTYQHPVWATVLEWLLAIGAIAIPAFAATKLRPLHTLALVTVISTVVLWMSYQLMKSGAATLHAVPQLLALFGGFLLTLLLNKSAPSAAASRKTTASQSPAISMDTLKTLALTLHGQGQLDLAFETLRRCAPNRDTLDLIYRLAADYERRREVLKAAQAYRYVGELDQQYKDAAAKAKQLQQQLERPRPAPKAASPAAPANALSNISKPKPAGLSPVRDANKETLGRYEIDRQIGKGAMGVVYLGRDPKINRIVAIKAIPLADEFEDQDLVEARERFFREAEMAGRLNHPGIVTIFDAGEDRDLAYIAMEYIQGEHLSYYCEPSRLLPIRKVLTLVIRVAEALNYAHLQNVVHRDIKPANIMYNIDTDALKITDFGIARLSDVSRTKTGIVLGTPSFMSPEQLEGRPLDGRSDLFGLGVTLYQMLTGQLPFRADSMTRLMNNIATEPHPPIRSLRPELPECMEQIIDRCLAKSADDRYQNGIDMADAIRNCMRGLA